MDADRIPLMAPLPVVVDAGLLKKTIEVLRRSPERLRCFWCARPLEQGVCTICDAECAS